MFSICATKKLADPIGITLALERSESTTRLGDWYANRVFIRPKQHVIFVNETTLLPIIVPLTPAKTLLPRFVQQYGTVLRHLGVDEASIAVETASMDAVAWAKTTNRSVVGSMNGFIKDIEFWNGTGDDASLTKLAVRLAGTPCRVGRSQPIWPDEETLKAFTSTQPPQPNDSASVHQLKVTLHTVKPPVWRRIQVPSNMPLDKLAPVLEAAMGWLGGHLHSYESGNIRYQQPDPDGFFDSPMFRSVDESTITLGEVLPAEKAKMTWDYDFGDGWEHTIVVEQIFINEDNVTLPRCITGRRACPPEDCGGPCGYQDLLHALADPTHEQHEELSEWAPSEFDPEHFSTDETTQDMQSPRPLHRW